MGGSFRPDARRCVRASRSTKTNTKRKRKKSPKPQPQRAAPSPLLLRVPAPPYRPHRQQLSPTSSSSVRGCARVCLRVCVRACVWMTNSIPLGWRRFARRGTRRFARVVHFTCWRMQAGEFVDVLGHRRVDHRSVCLKNSSHALPFLVPLGLRPLIPLSLCPVPTPVNAWRMLSPRCDLVCWASDWNTAFCLRREPRVTASPHRLHRQQLSPTSSSSSWII